MRDEAEVSQLSAAHLVDDLSRLCVAEVVSLIRPRATDKGLQFDVKFEDPIPKHVMTDSVRLKQVMMNLLGNSVINPLAPLIAASLIGPVGPPGTFVIAGIYALVLVSIAVLASPLRDTEEGAFTAA